MKPTPFSKFFESQEYAAFLNRNSTSNHDKIDIVAGFISDLIEEVLSDRQKKVIFDYYFKELNIPQIAKLYGVNKSTISRTKKRAENNIMRYLKFYSFR